MKYYSTCWAEWSLSDSHINISVVVIEMVSRRLFEGLVSESTTFLIGLGLRQRGLLFGDWLRTAGMSVQ